MNPATTTSPLDETHAANIVVLDTWAREASAGLLTATLSKNIVGGDAIVISRVDGEPLYLDGDRPTTGVLFSNLAVPYASKLTRRNRRTAKALLRAIFETARTGPKTAELLGERIVVTPLDDHWFDGWERFRRSMRITDVWA